MNMDLKALSESLTPEMIQKAYKLYSYVSSNMNEIRNLIVTDPEFKSQKSLDLINEFGAIKYPEKNLLERQKLVREELSQIIPELKKSVKF